MNPEKLAKIKAEIEKYKIINMDFQHKDELYFDSDKRSSIYWVAKNEKDN